MIALFTDSHFGIGNFNKQLFHYQLDYFKNDFFPYLVDNNIENVICLGDITHHRQFIDIYIQQKLEEEFFSFFEKNKIKLYIIAGNHDVFYKDTNEISYIQLLKKFKNIVVIDKPKVITIDNVSVGFVPWGMEEYAPEPSVVDVLCTHSEIGGVKINKYTTSKNSHLKLSDFKDYKLVLSGHYHTASKNGNVVYLGTPYQMDRNDYGERKGSYTFDGKNLQLVENTSSPKFVNVKYFDDGKKVDIKVDDGIIDTKTFDNIDKANEYISHNFVDVYIEKYKNEALLDKFVGKIENNKRQQNNEILEESIKEMAGGILESYSLDGDDSSTSNLDLAKDYISQMNFEDEEIVMDRILNRFVELYNDAVIIGGI
jgi:DNA repair exonuclease SbcCD nuclease subunit